MHQKLSDILHISFRNYPLFRVVIALSLGIFVGDVLCERLPLNSINAFGFDWTSILLIFCCILLLAPFFVGAYILRKHNVILHLSYWFWSSVWGAFFGLGILMMHAEHLQNHVKWDSNATVHRVLITADVTEKGKVYQTNAILQGGTHHGSLIKLSLMKGNPMDFAVKNEMPAVGDEILCYGKIEIPKNAGNPYEFDYAGWLSRQGISGVLFSPDSCWSLVAEPTISPPFSVRMLQLRESLVNRYREYLSGDELAILSAMTLGDKSALQTHVRDIFSQTGTSHVLALSGLHLGLLFSLFHIIILKYCRRRWAYIFFSIVGICLMWSFALLAGLPKSLIRATLMFSMVQICRIFSQRSSSLNNLSFAALVILLFSPNALFDVGFQLSCLSVFFILLIIPHLRPPVWVTRYKILDVIFNLITVPLCAQLCTAPLVGYYFHTFPVYGLLANFIAVPLAYILLGVSAIFLTLPLLQSILGPVLSHVSNLLYQGLVWVSSLPFASLQWYPSVWTVISLYLLVLLLYLYSRLHRLQFYVSVSLVLVFASVMTFVVEQQNRVQPSIICYNTYRIPAVHFITSTDESVLWSTHPERADSALVVVERNYWTPLHIASPRFISSADSICGTVSQYGAVLSFRKYRLAVVDDKFRPYYPSRPLYVDAMLLSRGSKYRLSELLRTYSPHLVILDGSLTPYYRNRYIEEISTLHIPYHDMNVHGAFVHNF